MLDLACGDQSFLLPVLVDAKIGLYELNIFLYVQLQIGTQGTEEEIMKVTSGTVVFFFGAALLAITCSMASAAQRTKECQILDALPQDVYEFDLEYIPSSEVDGFGKTDMIGMSADWAFAYFRFKDAGDIDLNLRAESTIFVHSLDGFFPSQVGKMALDAGWALRLDQGYAVQARAQPGLYSSFNTLSSDAFFCPFSLALIRAFDPSLSAMAGVEVRPDFDLPVMPLIGAVWAINDNLTLDARCPRSKLNYCLARNWNTYLAFDWVNMTYAVSGVVDRMTMNDLKAYWGISCQLSNQALLRAEVGTIFDRSVKYENSSLDVNQEADIERACFFRLGIGAAF